MRTYVRTEKCLPKLAKLVPVRWQLGILLGLLFCSAVARADTDLSTPLSTGSRGFAYRHDAVAEVPWSIHIVKIDRERTDFEFTTTLAKGSNCGLSTLSEQIKSVPPEWGHP